MSSISVDPGDLSPLLFRQEGVDAQLVRPYIGPIQLMKVKNGRGLVAARDISAGECLVVIQPTFSVPVDAVRERWMETSTSSSSTLSIEAISEEILRQTIREAINGKNIPAAKSALALVGVSSSEASDEYCLSVERLLGKDQEPLTIEENDVSDSDLLQIIRRNAFGPDFVTYSVIERKWNADPSFRPNRILGLYPLAAMINHSCAPNALRVFAANDVMLVHSSENIAAGTEIVWSYLPPTLPYPQRQESIQMQHGFVCACPRCSCEKSFWHHENTKKTLESNVRMMSHSAFSPDDVEGRAARSAAIQTLEEDIMSDRELSNELKRYLRVGFTQLYIQHLNAVVQEQPVESSILNLCMHMHFSFCACDNACTEHLSILHLCYELIGRIHTSASDKSKTMPKLRFWTEQVKRACMIRYGSLGNNLESVRAVMQHSRHVLRNKNGMDKANYPFI